MIHGADDPLIPVECGKDTAETIPGGGTRDRAGHGRTISPNALVPLYLQHIGDFVAGAERRQAG